MIPVKTGLTLPEFVAGPGATMRHHNATLKTIMRDEASNHLVKRVPGHFQQSAHSKYKYDRRTPKYLSWKIKNRGKVTNVTDSTGAYLKKSLDAQANLDLVKTGETKRRIAAGHKITVSGTGNRIRSTLKMQVPIPGGRTGRDKDMAASLRLLAAGKLKKVTNRVRAEANQETNRRTLNEIERFAPDEVKEISESIANKYATSITKSPRRKVK